MADQNRYAVSALSRFNKSKAINEELIAEKRLGEFSLKNDTGTILTATKNDRIRSHIDFVSVLAKDYNVKGQMSFIEPNNVELPMTVDRDAILIPELEAMPLIVSTTNVPKTIISVDYDCNTITPNGESVRAPIQPTLSIDLTVEQILNKYSNPTINTDFNLIGSLSTVSTDNKMIAFGGKSPDGTESRIIMILFTGDTPIIKSPLVITQNTITDMKFTPDGKYLLVGNNGNDGLISYKVDLNEPSGLKEFYVFSFLPVTKFDISRDGEKVVVTGSDVSFTMLNLYEGTGVYVSTFNDAGTSFKNVKFNYDGSAFVAINSTNSAMYSYKVAPGSWVVTKVGNGDTFTTEEPFVGQIQITTLNQIIYGKGSSLAIQTINSMGQLSEPKYLYTGTFRLRTVSISNDNTKFLATTVEGSNNVIIGDIVDNNLNIVTKNITIGAVSTVKFVNDDQYVLALATNGSLKTMTKNTIESSPVDVTINQLLNEDDKVILFDYKNNGFKLRGIKFIPNSNEEVETIVHSIIVVS